MMKSTTKVTVRAEINADGTGRLGSIFGELDAEIPPTPKLIAERIALLKICDVGTKLNGIGRRMFGSIYYIYLTNEEVKQISEEIKRDRCNAVDG